MTVILFILFIGQEYIQVHLYEWLKQIGFIFRPFLGEKFLVWLLPFIWCHLETGSMLSFSMVVCSVLLSFVLMLAKWLPQLQAILLHAKQKEVGKMPPFSRKPKMTLETCGTTLPRSHLPTPV